MKSIYLCIVVMFFMGAYALTAQQQISGTVTDQSGQPIPGASIVIRGTTTGVSTDFDGKYLIRAEAGDELEFSSVGFATQSIVVGNAPEIHVVLLESTAYLDEIVVIGYGTSTKRELVSSVVSVKEDVLENQPVSRLDQALQGRAAGVSVTSNSGTPGGGATIRIRGNNSITGNNAPLYVLDGFIVGTGFNLNSLNVNDIKSVEILKDATALAVFGTRGASGVILITTKNGSEQEVGKTAVRVNHYTTIQNAVNQIEILDGQDYIDYINESAQFVPGPDGFGFTDTTIPPEIDDSVEVPTTDWIDLVEQTGTISNTDLSISANTKSSNYFVSINHFDQKGVLRASGFQRVILNANIGSKISDKVRFGLRLNGTHSKRERNKVSYNNIIQWLSPLRPIFDEDGNFTNQNFITGQGERNPEADIRHREDHLLQTKVIANSYLEFELAKGLLFKSTFGAHITHQKSNSFRPSIVPQGLSTIGAQGRVEDSFAQSYLNENTFDYKTSIGDDQTLKVLAGFTWQKNNIETSFAQAEQLPVDAVGFNGLGTGSDINDDGASNLSVGSNYSQRTLVSLVGRIDYGYKGGKYLLTLAGRYDGSSVFEEGEKYEFFPSVGVAWNAGEERFFDNIDFVDKLKLRVSYGAVGEQGVNAYSSLAFYNPTTNVFNNIGVGGVLPSSLPSEGLTWETTRMWDVGLELGLLKNRLSLEVDYYDKTTEDLLLAVSIAAQAGGGNQLQNVGSIENKGIDVTLSSTNIERKHFSWNTQLTISGNRSKVLKLNEGTEFINLPNAPGGRLIVGETMPSFVGLKYLGTYKNAQEIIDDNRVGLSFIGGPRFENLDDNPDYNSEDYQIIGNPEPDFYGGIRNSFQYKNWNLDVFFHGQYGGDLFYENAQVAFFGRSGRNLLPEVANRWREGVNETSDIPRAGTTINTFIPPSTKSVVDGSFLRLKQVTLNYDLPIKNTELEKTFSRISLYATGNNLLLFSEYKTGDPEANSVTGNRGFGSVSQGFINGIYPYARSFTMGVRVEF
ncbi:MAG: SusC/RagA family TonB-linked outer membrane protein [Flavobacteriaceae bacterium]